jgi:hypothetical protein
MGRERGFGEVGPEAGGLGWQALPPPPPVLCYLFSGRLAGFADVTQIQGQLTFSEGDLFWITWVQLD